MSRRTAYRLVKRVMERAGIVVGKMATGKGLAMVEHGGKVYIYFEEYVDIPGLKKNIQIEFEENNPFEEGSRVGFKVKGRRKIYNQKMKRLKVAFSRMRKRERVAKV